MEHERPMSLIDEDRQPQGALGDATTFRKKAEGIERLERLLLTDGREHGQAAAKLVSHLRHNQLVQSLIAIGSAATKLQSGLGGVDQIDFEGVYRLAALVEVMGRLARVPIGSFSQPEPDSDKTA